MSLIDTAKEHPYVTGGIALAAIVVIVLFMGASGEEEASAMAPLGPVETGNAMYAIDRQAATQSLAIASELEAIKVKGANELAIANLQAASYNKSQEFSRDIATLQITKEAETRTLESNLLAQIRMGELENQAAYHSQSFASAKELEQIRSAERIATNAYLRDIVTAQSQAQINAQENQRLMYSDYLSSQRATADIYASQQREQALSYERMYAMQLGNERFIALTR